MDEPITPADLPRNDEMRVTPELVRKLGAIGALVWERIKFRQGHYRALPDPENGEPWWRANLEVLSADTGLSKDSVGRAIRKLEAAGHIESRQLGKERWDRTKSYRVVVSAESAPGPSGLSSIDNANSQDQEDANSRDLPPTKQTYKAGEKHGKARHGGRPTAAQLRLLDDFRAGAGIYGTDNEQPDNKTEAHLLIEDAKGEYAKAAQRGELAENIGDAMRWGYLPSPEALRYLERDDFTGWDGSARGIGAA